jgi:microcystin-dependent protein
MVETKIVAARIEPAVAIVFSFPSGTIAAFAGASIPSGYLLCDGSAISRTTYATLYALIGTTYGNGDGINTFNIPDCRGKAPFGKASSGTFQTLGSSGGNESHTHIVDNHTHTYAGQNHQHSSSHMHYINLNGFHTHTGFSGTGSLKAGSIWLTDGPDHQHGIWTGSQNVNTGFTNAPLAMSQPTTTSISHVNPFAVVNFIIRT